MSNKPTEINVVIGANDHEPDEYMRDIYCPELKQAISGAFPGADVEVTFSPTSPVFKVMTDGDEVEVKQQVESIHEKLWNS